MSLYFTHSRLAMTTYGDAVLAYSVVSSRAVAIKRSDVASAQRHRTFQVPAMETAKDINVERRVLQRIAAVGGHPHIVVCLDTFCEFGYDQLVLEHCPQGLPGMGYSKEDDALDVFAQVVDAVTFLHQELGLAHGALDDMRHYRLLEGNHVKLIDFALAAQLNASTSLRDMQALGKLLKHLMQQSPSYFVQMLAECLVSHESMTLDELWIALQTRCVTRTKPIQDNNYCLEISVENNCILAG
ncbi:hypothetical protein AC1031_020431 [Aphanomyces cochlioides]|nr:hypothetical protein AC1031_020431 [Aphanomyces cochlioides]